MTCIKFEYKIEAEQGMNGEGLEPLSVINKSDDSEGKIDEKRALRCVFKVPLSAPLTQD